MRRVVVISIIGTVVTAGFAGLLIRRASAVEHTVGIPYVRGFETPSSPIDIMLASGDGQAFAALARDPSLARPEAFRAGRRAAAFRAQRPAPAYLAFLLSTGDPTNVPGAMVALAIIGGGLATAGTALLLTARSALPALGLGVIVLPGSIAALSWLGPELLGLGFVLLGVAALDRGRPAIGVVLLSMGGLTKETYLLIPLILCVRAASRRAWASVFAYSIPLWLFALWNLVVWSRFGAWPFEGGPGGLSLPFVGIVEGIGRWNGALAEPALAVALAAVSVFVLLRRRHDPFAPYVFGFVALATIMGAEVWRRWEDFSRPLLPLCVFGLLCLVPRPDEGAPDQVSVRSAAERDG